MYNLVLPCKTSVTRLITDSIQWIADYSIVINAR